MVWVEKHLQMFLSQKRDVTNVTITGIYYDIGQIVYYFFIKKKNIHSTSTLSTTFQPRPFRGNFVALVLMITTKFIRVHIFFLTSE